MLPPKNHGGRQLFTGSMGKSKRFSNNLFSLELLSLTYGQPPKMAVVVSKKHAKTAVLRNLIKRRIYAILIGELNNINNSVGIIVFTKAGLEGVDYKVLKESLTTLLATTSSYNHKHV